MQLFEPSLLRNLLLEEFNAVRTFLAPYAAKYNVRDNVIQTVSANIPAALPTPEIGAFRDELSKSADSAEAMEKALRFLGKKTFVRLFPL